jgi:hypothetical protein
MGCPAVPAAAQVMEQTPAVRERQIRDMLAVLAHLHPALEFPAVAVAVAVLAQMEH